LNKICSIPIAGRRMFPTLEYKVYGLKPEATYNMYVDMVLVDVNHWKFNSGKWVPSGQAEQCQKTSKDISLIYIKRRKCFIGNRSCLFASGFTE
jgi:hypothetical protein